MISLWKDDEFRSKMKLVYVKNMTSLRKQGKLKPPSWLGRQHSETTKKAIGITNSKKQLGNQNSQYGTAWICHKDHDPQKIKVNELQNWIDKGWKRGRK